MEDNEIDQFISVLRYNGIRIPKILTQRSCKQNKKKYDSNESKYDLAITKVFQKIRKINELKISDENKWLQAKRVFLEFEDVFNDILNASLNNGDQSSISIFFQTNESKLLITELNNLLGIIQINIVPIVSEYYRHKTRTTVNPWDYDVLDFANITNTYDSVYNFEKELRTSLQQTLPKFSAYLDYLDKIGFLDLNNYSGKNVDGLSVYCDSLSATFISICPTDSIRDSIYFGHEVGHALFNFKYGVGTLNYQFKALSSTESFASSFELQTIRNRLEAHGLFSDYIYELLSAICYHAADLKFILCLYKFGLKEPMQKSNFFLKCEKLYTPWTLNGSENTSTTWMSRSELFEEPLYETAYVISKINAMLLLIHGENGIAVLRNKWEYKLPKEISSIQVLKNAQASLRLITDFYVKISDK